MAQKMVEVVMKGQVISVVPAEAENAIRRDYEARDPELARSLVFRDAEKAEELRNRQPEILSKLTKPMPKDNDARALVNTPAPTLTEKTKSTPKK